MKQHGDRRYLPRLPRGTTIPTGVFEFDDFFGGGLKIGDFFGFVQRGACLFADVDMMLQLAYAASACASVACFITPQKKDAGKVLQNMSLKDGFLPTLNQENALLLQIRDSLQGREWVMGGTDSAEHVFPFKLVQDEELSLADIEQAAESFEVVVIDQLDRIKEAQEEKGLYILAPSPKENAYDRVRSICKKTGALVIAGNSISQLRKDNSDTVRYTDQNPPFAFDKAVVVDFLLTPEEPLDCDVSLSDPDMCSSGDVRVCCTDRNTGRESDFFYLDYILGKGFASSLDRLIGASSGHSLTDGDRSFYGSRAFRLPSTHAGNDPVQDKEPEGAEHIDSEIKAWFAREIERRRCPGGGHPFSRHITEKRLPIDADALLGGLKRHEEELVLHQSPFSPSIETVLSLLKHDFPELFFVKGIESMEKIGDFLWLVTPSYRLSPSAAVETLCRIDEVVDPLLEEAKEVPNIDEKVGFLHDWLCAHVVHTGDEIDGFTEIDAPFLLGRGSSQAITKAWHYLCDRAEIGATPTVGTKKGRLAVWSIAAIQPGRYEDCSRETLKFLHYAIAEDVLLSNIAGSTSRMYYGAQRDELSKWGYETPFEFVNEYAFDLQKKKDDE